MTRPLALPLGLILALASAVPARAGLIAFESSATQDGSGAIGPGGDFSGTVPVGSIDGYSGDAGNPTGHAFSASGVVLGFDFGPAYAGNPTVGYSYSEGGVVAIVGTVGGVVETLLTGTFFASQLNPPDPFDPTYYLVGGNIFDVVLSPDRLCTKTRFCTKTASVCTKTPVIGLPLIPAVPARMQS